MRLFGALPLDVPVLLGRSDAQRRAAAELAKAKYGGLPDWVINALRSLQRLVQSLLGLLDRVPGPSGGVNLVVIISTVLLVAAIVIIIWRVGLPRLRRRIGEAEVSLDTARSPASYRARAEDAAAAGQFRVAVGERFRALVRELEERTVLDPRPARTATEVAFGAGVLLVDQRPALRRAAAIFSDAWYGDRPVLLASYRELAELETDITAAADRVDLADSSGTEPRTSVGAARSPGAVR